jgi:lipopolysaccharide/colanic/teichoic acid biosynthesis glycosyltransferase/glycosyltransferase involved in cell wall biosynthesis
MIRRTVDIIASTTALVLLAPLLGLLALLVRFTMGRPVLFQQWRAGQNGKPFRLIKFRTMRVGAEQSGGSLTFQADPRITSVGRLLRDFKLDELPQFWNVLRGEMTLIGPRPEVLDWVERYTPEQREVLKVKPGLGDPVQLLFRHEQDHLTTSVEYERLYPIKVRKQLEYLRSRTVFSDIRTLLLILGSGLPSKPSRAELELYASIRHNNNGSAARRPLRIGLFPLEIGRNVGGLEVYETNLIRALAEVDSKNEYRIFCLDRRVPEILGLQAQNFQYEVIPVNRWRGVLWDAPRAMVKAKLDLFHALFVPPPFTSVPYVFTHHGTEVIERPDFYPWLLGWRMRVLFRRAFRKAQRILCASDYNRQYLACVQRIPQDKLRTVYLACRSGFRPVEKAAARQFLTNKYSLNSPYILNVGRIEPRKNPIRVLKAYDRFRRSVENPPKLAFVGEKTWSARELDRTVKECGLEAFIVELGYLSDEELPMVYAGAEFVVYASLWEGFGLPVLEAFATGTPLITSNTTCLPEIAQNACLLVDPYDLDAMAAAMKSLHSDGELRQRLIARGLARNADFSWERTAQETITSYEEIGYSMTTSNPYRSGCPDFQA